MNKVSQVHKNVIIACCIGFSMILSTAAFAEDYTTGVFGFQQKLAESGNAQAQYKLGTMYETGRGIGMDTNKALDWYKKAAAQNYRSAENRIVYLDIKKTGYQANKHGQWLNALKQHADQGDGEAMMLLANAYKNGYGLEQDLSKAQELYAEAAKKDIAGSEAELDNTNILIKKTQQAKRSQQQAQQQAQQQKHAEEEYRRKQAAEQQAITSRNQAARLGQEKAAANEQQRIQAERQRLEADKRNLELQQRELARQQQAQQQRQQQQQAVEAAPEEEEGFQRDACQGKKARFLTVCQ